MGIETFNFDNFERDLEKRYGKRAMQDAQKRAVKAGAHMLRNKTGTALYQVKDTGKLAVGTDVRDPELINGEVVAYIYWRGEHRSLAHLVNNGFRARDGRFIKGRGYQKVDTVLKLNADLYYSLLKRELNK